MGILGYIAVLVTSLKHLHAGLHDFDSKHNWHGLHSLNGRQPLHFPPDNPELLK